MKPHVGRPLLLKKALYGYSGSGKCLYDAQADFLSSYGLQKSSLMGLWYKRINDKDLLMVLHYSDDCLSACTDPERAFGDTFDTKWQDRADWYLSSRLSQDASGNISLDQYRYCRSITTRYLPNADPSRLAKDKLRYADPLPVTFRWTNADCSKTKEEVEELETMFGFLFIEAVGSLNYLVNTSPRIVYAVRKACKFMQLPRRVHFHGLLHLLHHLRCHPAKPLLFYRAVEESPLASLIKAAGHPTVDPSFCIFSDSSFQDCDDLRSTGSHLIFLQGGVAEHASGVPVPIANSTMEAEVQWLSMAVMAGMYVRRAYCEVLLGNVERPFTVPVFTDSGAALAFTKTEKDSKRSRHIERRFQYARYAEQNSLVKHYHVDGDKYMIADIGTKAKATEEVAYKLSIVEGPAIEHKEDE